MDASKTFVLINSTCVDRSKCPEAVRYRGKPVPMKKWLGSLMCWDYKAVKKAFDNI